MGHLEIGSLINRYEIRNILHQSELIAFCEAYDTKLERLVFLRVIVHSVDYSEDAIGFFIREAKILANLNHKNISNVLDFGMSDENLFLVSEYVSGKKLTELLGTPIDWREAVNLILPISEALDYAQQKDVIHRDLKPDNIIISTDNQPIICDFSLIRIIEPEETREMTGTNVGLGSPEYISPEQGKGFQVDYRSDMYSLGIIFYEMVTGKKPFNAQNSMEIVIQHIAAKPPSPQEIIPSIPLKVVSIILKLMNKDAENRYVTFGELTSSLRSLIEEPKTDKTSINPFYKRYSIPLILSTAILILFSGLLIFNNNRDNSKTTSELIPPELQISISTSTTINKSPTVEKNTLATNKNTEHISTYTPIATQDPFLSIFNLQTYPTLLNRKSPLLNTRILPENVSKIIEIGDMGYPQMNQYAWIPETKLLAAATSAGVYIIDANELKILGFFDAKGWIVSIAVSPNGQLIATGDIKGNIGVWDTSTGVNVMFIPGHKKEINSIDFSPDNSKLITAGQDLFIRLWDINQKSLISETKKHAIRINKVKFSSDGNFIYSVGDDFQIMVWDGFSGSFVHKMQAAKKITDFDLTKKGNLLVLALNNGTIEFWDTENFSKIDTFSDQNITSSYRSVAFFPSENIIVTGGEDGIIRVFNIALREQIWKSSSSRFNEDLINLDSISNFTLSDNGSLLVSLSKNGTTVLWDLTNQSIMYMKDYKYNPIEKIEIAKNDLIIAFQGGKESVEVWTINPSKNILSIQGSLLRGKSIDLNSKYLTILSEELMMYSLNTDNASLKFILYGYTNNATANYFLDNKIFAISSAGKMLYWSTNSGRELTPTLIQSSDTCRVFYDSEGRFLAAGSPVGITESPENFESLCKVTRSARTINEDYLNDGSMIAFALENGKFEIWNSVPTIKKSTFQSELSQGNLNDISISPDGQIVAIASEDGYLEFYDTISGILLHNIYFGSGAVNQVSFANNGNFLIIGLDDGTIRLIGFIDL